MNIHLIENMSNFVKLSETVWESGWWSLNENRAKKLVGSEIYFHKKQREPSFFGGIITGYRIEEHGEYQGMIVFELQYSEICRNVKTDKHGWSRKMKIVDHA